MAFNPNLLNKLAPFGSIAVLAESTSIGNQYRVPQQWSYNAGADTQANVLAAGYFTYFADFLATLLYNDGSQFRVGDVIYCVCSDANTWITVTAIGATITTTSIGSGPNSVATGDIQDAAVTTIKVADANITLAKLAAGITPSHVIKFASQLTTVGGAAAEAFAVAGAVAATDRAFVQIVNDGTNNRTALQAVVTNNVLTVTFSGDPGNDLVFNYQLIRVAA